MRFRTGHRHGFAANSIPSSIGGESLHRKLGMSLAIALLLAAGICSLPTSAAQQSIQKVEVGNLPDVVQITVASSAPLAMRDSRLGKYIVFDLYGSLNPKEQRRVDINSGGIRGVRCARYKESPPVARIVVSTAGLREYSVRAENGKRRTIIEVQKAGSAARPSGGVVTARAEPVAAIKSKPIDKVDAKAVAPKPAVVVEAKPVLVASAVGMAPSAKRVVAVSPAPRQVSLDFVASDINDVLKGLAMQSGVNIVASPEVKGEVTVSLNKVTAEEALKLVVNLSGYKFAVVDGTYVVGTQENLKNLAAGGVSAGGAEKVSDAVVIRHGDPAIIGKILEKELGTVQVTSGDDGKDPKAQGPAVLILSGRPADVQAAKAMVQSIEQSVADYVASSVTELYEVRYAEITELPPLLTAAIPGLSVAIGPNQGFKLECPSAVAMGSESYASSTASKSGQPQIAPAKVLILRGTEEEIAKAKELLARLDVAQPQIIIEAEVVDITDTASKELGIQWGEEGVVGSPVFTESRDSEQALSIGRFARSAISVKAILRALVEDGKGKVLANPKVLSLDGKPASVFIGDEVKYVIRVDVTPQGTNVTTETARVGVQLHTISRISADGYITMNLHPEVSVITDWIDTPAGLTLPEISRRFIDSTIRVKDGETIVIGGLIKDQEIQSISGIPILKDLPILGELFKFKSSRKTRSEVVMFITPRIVATT